MTPYEHLFARPEFEEELFPAIFREAEAHALDTRNRDEFLQLPSASAVLEKLSPPGSADASPVPGVAALAYQGYHFWRNGAKPDVLSEDVVRTLLDPDAADLGTWPLQAPAQAGYVVLPANLVWAKTDQGAPEALHGFFYTTSPHGSAAGSLALLIALGVRDDRAGVTAIEINVTLPVFPPGHFGDLDARDEGVDFENILPGGELRGLFSVTNAGEVLKLVSRALHYLGARES
jgi:hypothetical protein